MFPEDKNIFRLGKGEGGEGFLQHVGLQMLKVIGITGNTSMDGRGGKGEGKD